MEDNPARGRRSRPHGPREPPKITPAVEKLQSRLQEILNMLTPEELHKFRVILKTVDEEPRVSDLKLELEGRSASGLACLLVKHYYLPIAPRVVTKVLERLCRADLLRRWKNYRAADAGAVIPRKLLKRSFDCVEGELDRYDLSCRRQAFLMCVQKNRPGADRDVQLMEDWLGQCGFESTLCIDPDKTELLEKLTSFRDELNEIKAEVSCCLVTLMSHGKKGWITMKDGDEVSLEDVFAMFNNKNCPALHEKPKIFIIQACRGEKRDSGVETDDEPMDSDDVSEKRRLPTFSDYFIIYPTQADYVALRHPRTGSVMIEAMTEVFKQYGNRWHIADFFTKVNNSVVHTSFHLHGEPIKVSLVMESTLTRFVYF